MVGNVCVFVDSGILYEFSSIGFGIFIKYLSVAVIIINTIKANYPLIL